MAEPPTVDKLQTPCGTGSLVQFKGSVYRCEVGPHPPYATYWQFDRTKTQALKIARDLANRKPKKTPAPAPGGDPRTLPCTVGDTVTWEGKGYECRQQRLRDGRSRTFWQLEAEERPGFNPETGRVTTEEGQIVRIVNAAITTAIHAAFVAAGLGGLSSLAGKLHQLTAQSETFQRIANDLSPALDRIKRESDRVKGILGDVRIANTIRVLRTAHQLGRITSTWYRGKIDDVYAGVGQASRVIFGRAEVATSALVLVRMARADLAAIQGKPIDDSLQGSLQDMERIALALESKSRLYAQSPWRFFEDLDRDVLQPILAQTANAGTQLQKNMSRAQLAISQTAQVADLVTQRLGAYQARLDPFLSDSQLAEIDAIRRDLTLGFRRSLHSLDDWFEDEWPVQFQTIAGNVEGVKFLNEEVDDLQTLIPTTVDPEAATAVRRRRVWADLLDDTVWNRDISEADFQAADERTRRIFSALED